MASAVALAGLFTPEASCVACSRDFLASRQCDRASGSSNSGGSKLWSSMRASSAFNRRTPMKVRQLEAPLSVSKFVRFQGKEASCLRRGEKCVPIEQGSAKQCNKLGGRPEFSATSGLWPRMVFGGSARASCRPSLVDAAVRAISSERLRARDDSSGRLRVEASRETFVGWRRFVPIETSTVGLTRGLSSEAHALTTGTALKRSLRTLASSAAEGIVAEPSSLRKSLKKKEIVPDQRLSGLREAFGKEGDNAIDAYIIPSEDPHQSEFIADCFQRRAFISGFTGSSGTAVVTKEHAALWTDGRYFLQAEKELGPGWTLMRQGTAGVPPVGDWLREVLVKGSTVGIDPFLFSADAAEDLRQTLRAGDLKLLLLYEENLVDRVWGEKRPRPPTAQMRVHDLQYAGVDVRSKIASIRDSMKAAGATAHIISMLDEVAWVLNLRGGDVPHSPVTYAYLVIEQEVATLFVDEVKITPAVASHLKGASVTVQPYTSLVPSIQRLAEAGAKLWMDPKRLSVAIVEAFNNACSAYYDKATVSAGNKDRFHERLNGPAAIARNSPVSLAKALKNPSELEGMRQAHLRDAAALAEFWAWLEDEVVDQGKSLTEVEVADRLEEIRAKQAGFLDTSFDTIAGSGANGAIVHYRAEPSSCGEVNNQKLFLLDSGAQFVDGTTDITRTVHFGTPTARQQECFTRVLQGHIAVDKAVFPEHTPGFVLDVLARSSLWKIGLDYRHGTGHGVGAALNVHEGPQSISSRFGNMTGLQAGMIVSNEPGYYEDRSFGIRIENLLIVREVDTPNNYGGTTYLGFERLTYVPIQTKMLDVTIMSEEEIDWLNAYHTEVWEKISPLLDGEAHAWLQRNTELISNKTIGEDKVVVAGTT